MLVNDAHSPMKGPEYWATTVGTAALVSAAALVAARVSLLIAGRPARIVCAGAAIALVVATILQPGLSLNTHTRSGLARRCGCASRLSAAGGPTPAKDRSIDRRPQAGRSAGALSGRHD